MNYRRRRDLLSAAFWWAALLFTIGFWWSVFTVLWITFGHAHDAIPTAEKPLGWKYPVNCCHDLDCGMITYQHVKETPDGYVISLKKSDHVMLVKDTVFVIGYTDPRIKDSPDGEYHICISRQTAAPTGDMLGGNVICFFVPPKGS